MKGIVAWWWWTDITDWSRGGGNTTGAEVLASGEAKAFSIGFLEGRRGRVQRLAWIRRGERAKVPYIGAAYIDRFERTGQGQRFQRASR